MRGDRQRGEKKWPPHVLANRTECAKSVYLVTQGGHDDDGSRNAVTKAALLLRPRRGVLAWQQWEAALADDHPARIIDAFVDGLDRISLQASYRESDLCPTPQTSCSRSSCMRPIKATCRPRDRLATSEIAMPCAGSAGFPAQPVGPLQFRDRLSEPVFEMHAQVIRQAIAEGLTAAEDGVLDGTSTRACASRHQLVDEERLTKRFHELNAAVAQTQPADRSILGLAGSRNPQGSTRPAQSVPTGGRRTCRAIGHERGTPQGPADCREKGESSITEPERRSAVIRRKSSVRCSRPNLSWIRHRS